MKVLHVFTKFGSTSFFNGQFKYLSDKGHDITIISSPDEKADAFCKRNNTKFIPLFIPRYISILLMLKIIWKLMRIIKKEQFDAVMGHTPIAALCAMIAAWLCRVRIRVFYRHGLLYTTLKGFRRYFYLTEERFVSWLATEVVVVSPSVAEISIKDHLTRPDKLFVIGKGTCGGIDTVDKFNPSLISQDKLDSLKKKYNLDKAGIVFGFSGRFVVDKGIYELIGGFEKFKNLHSDEKAMLMMVGGFDERDSLSKEFQEKMKKMKGVVITGRVPSDMMPYYYSLMDVLIFPSHREGFGMCSIEAAAMERPVIVNKCHGCVDSIVEGQTGLFLELSSNGVCQAMEKALNKAEMKEMGIRGRRFVQENFDWKVMFPMIEKMYVSLDKKHK
jgi:glycosyltransferase involved in cell wall biosynthesis